MAPVPFEHPVRYTSLEVTGAHLTSVVYLTYAVGVSLYTSYRSLAPAQDTRSGRSQRFKLVPVFVALAVAAFSCAIYTSLNAASLSYRVWANRHGVELPDRLIGEGGFFPSIYHSSQLYLAQWLSDTPIYYDALEIVAENARRFWWGQQVDLATTAFSLLLATEGRRRHIPMVTGFLALAHLVNLSFAQNLFYLALLLTPAPLPADEELELPVAPLRTSTWRRIRDRVISPKPANWHPHPLLFYSILALNYGSLFVLPYAAETPVLFPWDVEERSTWERSTTAFGRILRSRSDHPVVAAVAWDVIISAISLGLWAAVRAMDVHDIINSAIPFRGFRTRSLLPPNVKEGTPKPAIKAEPESAEEVESDHPMTLRRSGRQRKSRLDSIASSSGASEDITAPVPRKRGRPRKYKPVVEEDSAYEPTPSEAREAAEGNELPPDNLDWESAALVWGLTAAGGLASATAGVYGGECISR
ncbi:hypothetical protein DL766_004495 [Monosporascus sp. MC13-8B]|uniref:GPI mannosyltransferase 2 n=1 Tax=Monosporascus cannonballus TaxID=155416 RepID=A0ABY0H0Y7_9PEZI|nr:hypothetical protein DL762_007190 [Monosporascus cannonballus]RYO86128.1 hypothetical protein DL763_006821 [Monosporascus cannonballus]RYP31187.1 hypothetical protein DL766_004495 [Monosporascus sp. MC13-8B]